MPRPSGATVAAALLFVQVMMCHPHLMTSGDVSHQDWWQVVSEQWLSQWKACLAGTGLAYGPGEG